MNLKFNNNSNKTLNKRELEKNLNNNFLNKLKSTLYTLLNNDLDTNMSIHKMRKYLNNKSLTKGEWPYKNYYFSPKTNKYIDPDNCDSLEMFKNSKLLEDMLEKSENSLNFDCNPKIRKICNHVISKLIKNPIINSNKGEDSMLDETSYNNFSNAVAKAYAEGKKVVILSNHQNHIDTFILNYIFHNLHKDLNHKYLIPQKELRFISGAYMNYNDSVKAFPIGFDTTFVFGIEDMQEMIKYFRNEEKNNITLLRKIKDIAINSTTGNPKKEMALLYPYAGRSEAENGCKKEIPTGIKGFIDNKNCIYIPIGFNGSNEIYHNSTKTLISRPIINNITPKQKNNSFNYLKSNKVYMNIGKHFQGGDKTLEEINTQMHEVSNHALEKRTKK